MTKTERIESLEAFSIEFAQHILELRGQMAVIESTLERLDADRKTFVRHQETLCRNIRKLIAENRAFRADVNRRQVASINDLITAPLRMVPVLTEDA